MDAKGPEYGVVYDTDREDGLVVDPDSVECLDGRLSEWLPEWTQKELASC